MNLINITLYGLIAWLVAVTLVLAISLYRSYRREREYREQAYAPRVADTRGDDIAVQGSDGDSRTAHLARVLNEADVAVKP